MHLLEIERKNYITFFRVDLLPDMPIEKKEIQPGGLILQEKPFVYTLCSKFRTERCDFCFSK